ncbi:MAG: TonB-dependent receptor [Pyrinomonadaceae bacterium]|nr:TonB-dependent receptor [Sphingobacteriaceae bacterium]
MRYFEHNCFTKTRQNHFRTLFLCYSSLKTVFSLFNRQTIFGTANNRLIHLLSVKLRPASLLSYFTFLICLFISASGFAQNNVRIQGTVLDEKGITLPGVTVIVKGTTIGTSTDVNGKFSISTKIGETLVFTMIGYDSGQIVITTDKPISVSLTPNSSSLDEVVVVGYGVQKKGSVTGAVSSVSNKEIVTTKNENVQNMLTGKIAGLRIVQNSGEPGRFNNSFDVRGLGNPLIVIDGVPRDNMQRLNPADIESISILKDASAAIYGLRAANGVVLITTKKGNKGELSLTYNGTYSLQAPLNTPEPSNVFNYMTLANEQRLHNTGVGYANTTPLFTAADFEAYRNGTRIASNWQDAVIRKDYAPQTQHDISASGGNETTSYYASLGYAAQDAFFVSDDLKYKRFNLRSNISTKVSKRLTFDVNLSGILDQKDQPYNDPYWVYRSTWYQTPLQNIYANNNPDYFNMVPSGLNGVAQSQSDVSGYKVYNNKWFQSSASLNYDVPFVKGLSAKGMYSYDFLSNTNKMYQQVFNLYNYNAATDTYTPSPQQAPATIRREYAEFPSNLMQLSLNYKRTFLGDHNVSALFLYEKSKRDADNFNAQRELSIPVDQLLAGNSDKQAGGQSTSIQNLYQYENAAYVGRLAYDYKGKYLAEFAFREDGSSKFATNKQWGFFPVASAGWRVSEESFIKNSSLLSFVNNLKLRASYGELGDENASTYQFISGYNYPVGGSASGTPAGSVFNGIFVSGVQSKGLPNPNISWYTAKTFDAGIDFEGWNGLFGFTFDYFIRNRTGLLVRQSTSLPDVVGVGLPEENLNGDRSKGFDFDVSHRYNIGEFRYNIKGTFGLTRTMNTARVQARSGNSYLNWNNSSNTEDRWNNLYWGYGANGQFQSYADIVNSDIYVPKSTVVGDYRYEDWNGDGQISTQDNQPISTAGLPMVSYGLNLGAQFKGFDFSMTWSGAGNVYVSYFEQLNTPLWAGGNALAQFNDRWHPVDPTADPYSPQTVWVPGHFAYTGTIPFTNTLHNASSAAYIRLKNIELGYSIPTRLLSHVGLRGLRVFTNGYNLLTFTDLKYLDPEHPSSDFGYLYPVDKKFTFGLNMQF